MLGAVPHHNIKITDTLHLGHSVFTSTGKPIHIVTILPAADKFKHVIDEMIYGTDMKMVNMLDQEYVNFIQ